MAKTATATAPALPAAGTDAAVPGGKKKSKLLLVVVALVVLLGAGGGGAWWFLGRAPAATAEAKHEKARPPVFQNLEPFTVNLAEENGDHYLQMSVVFQVADEKAAEPLKTYLPIIRNRILLLLSSKRPSDLATPEGKQKLVAELVAAARESIPGEGDRGITSAFLGAFVIQ